MSILLNKILTPLSKISFGGWLKLTMCEQIRLHLLFFYNIIFMIIYLLQKGICIPNTVLQKSEMQKRIEFIRGELREIFLFFCLDV